jgi:hypothetical protein
MNDLNQIISNNDKAGAADIPKQRAAGKFVVARYTGISYLGHSVFATKAGADSFAIDAAKGLLASERIVNLAPISTPVHTPSGDAPATLASLAQAHADKVARNEALVAA